MPPIISSKRNRCRSSRCYPKTHSSKPEYNITDFAVVTSQREAFIQPERLDELLLNLFLPNVRRPASPRIDALNSSDYALVCQSSRISSVGGNQGGTAMSRRLLSALT